MIRHFIISDETTTLTMVDVDSHAALMDWVNWWKAHPERKFLRQSIVTGYKVSTICLTVYWKEDDRGLPVIWETIVWDPQNDVWQEDQFGGSRADAIANHNMWCGAVESWHRYRSSPWWYRWFYRLRLVKGRPVDPRIDVTGKLDLSRGPRHTITATSL